MCAPHLQDTCARKYRIHACMPPTAPSLCAPPPFAGRLLLHAGELGAMPSTVAVSPFDWPRFAARAAKGRLPGLLAEVTAAADEVGCWQQRVQLSLSAVATDPAPLCLHLFLGADLPAPSLVWACLPAFLPAGGWWRRRTFGPLCCPCPCCWPGAAHRPAAGRLGRHASCARCPGAEPGAAHCGHQRAGEWCAKPAEPDASRTKS